MHKHIVCVAQCVAQAFENELKLIAHELNHLLFALNNQINKSTTNNPLANVMLLLYFLS
jgi:hypothetical protein